MKMLFARLRRDTRGAAIVEFALAIPIFILFVMGFWQLGIVYWASAGVHNALGEAARYATIWPVPSTDDIEAMVFDREFGTHNGTLTKVDADAQGNGTILLTIEYEQPTDFIFFEGPTVELERTKLIYTAEATAADVEEAEEEEVAETG